ncbi:MAG: GIY-YIG nuclease family protein [Phycisphaeraceae bacterium]|nr:GIY-YIG nuclease family protein [Phycisphaeraceae bacterium]
MNWYVYLLNDPRDHRPTYVGQTTNVVDRWKKYQRGDGHGNWGLNQWLDELRLLHLEPGLELLATLHTQREADQREREEVRWRQLDGQRLFNIADGGRSGARTEALHLANSDWIALGQRMKDAHELLLALQMDAATIAGRRSRAFKSLYAAVQYAFKAKVAMEDRLCEVRPEVDWRGVFIGPHLDIDRKAHVAEEALPIGHA